MIAHARSPRYLFAVAASVVSGGLVALQTRTNGQFGAELGNGAIAALVSFGFGLIIIGCVTVATKRSREGVSSVLRGVRHGAVPWWMVMGGLFGAFLVLSQGLSAASLGVALFSVAVVTGQALGAVTIDTRGWLGFPKITLTLWRASGSLMVLGGVVVAIDVPSGALAGENLWLVLLPLAAGLGTGFQQAANGRVSTFAGSALSATFLNFAIGTAALAVVVAVSAPFTGLPESVPHTWWLWMGGPIGAVFIAIQVTTVSIIGVLGLGVSIVTGQLVGSILLDVFVPVGPSSVSFETFLGALITLVGAVAVTLSRRSA